MLGDFINRCLILLLGYAYPGFECYKTVEKNRVDIEELRFWCKYWTIVALFTVLEKFLDIFIAWVPMYGEMKLVLFVYMWYPKTRGTGFIYETVLRPYVSRHENDIDRTIQEWKARGWDYAIFYWQYLAQFGQTAFVQALQQLASQSSKLAKPTAPLQKSEEQDQIDQQISTMKSSFMKQNSSLSKSKKWPTSPPSTPTAIHRNISETPKSQTVHANVVDAQTEYLDEEEDEAWETESTTVEGEKDVQRVSVRDRINRARARLRKLDTQNPRTPKAAQRKQS